ncbi:MAG: urease accessory protein UreD [Deltaproteobacteria bacterium]|nr:urease accessory protein UreD [Myxococcales bacterium]MDP3213203.1 urease accessory protein UreD [Deltaproteobacteria bacterium]
MRGRSVATRARAHSPLRLLLPDNRGEALWAYTTSYGGGLVDGDALSLDAHVAAGAALMLATQASTKVFRGVRGSSQALSLRLDEGALAVVLPDPVVCFAGATYGQRTEVDLAPGASLVLVDGLHAGRVARGERWAFARYASRLDVRREGRLALSDRLLLDESHGAIAERLGAYDAFATLVLVGERVAPFAAALLERVGAAGPGAHADRIESATAVEGGTLLRVAAATAAGALGALRGHLGFLTALIGDDPFTRRW